MKIYLYRSSLTYITCFHWNTFFFFYCHFFTKKNTGTFGLIFTDVMADTLVVERMKSERHQDVGSMQTLCWCLRFGGNLVGLTIGGIQMSAFGVVPVKKSSFKFCFC